MKRALIAAALAALLSGHAYAETGTPAAPPLHPGMGPGMGGMGMHEAQPRDCSKAPDPAHCKAMQTAMDACKGMGGMEHRECMEEKMPPPDCSKAPNPEQCQKHQAAHEACKDKPVGMERHNCVMGKMGRPAGEPKPPRPQ